MTHPTQQDAERRSAIRALLVMFMWQLGEHRTLEEMSLSPLLAIASQQPGSSIAEEMTPEAYFRLLEEFGLMDYHVRCLEMMS